VPKIEELRRRLDVFVRQESSDYTDLTRVLIDSMENCNRLNVTLFFQHVSNWQDMDTQLARRSKMLTFIKGMLEELEITYLPPVQRVAIVPSNRQGTSLDCGLLTAGEASRLLEIVRERRESPV